MYGGALIRWMHFLPITSSFLAEGALIHEIYLFYLIKRLLSGTRAPPAKNITICLRRFSA